LENRLRALKGIGKFEGKQCLQVSLYSFLFTASITPSQFHGGNRRKSSSISGSEESAHESLNAEE
jgi:hypothetical protein